MTNRESAALQSSLYTVPTTSQLLGTAARMNMHTTRHAVTQGLLVSDTIVEARTDGKRLGRGCNNKGCNNGELHGCKADSKAGCRRSVNK